MFLNKRVLLIFALLMSVFVACSQPTVQEVVPALDTQADILIDIAASTDAPAVGETVDLTITVTSRGTIESAKIQANAPDQLKMADAGELWSGKLSETDTVSVNTSVDVMAWPMKKPLEIVVVAGAGEYRAYWPEDLGYNPNHEIVLGVNTTIDPSPSIGMKMTMSPENPKVGDIVRFDVTMQSQVGVSDVKASLTLPEGMAVRQFEKDQSFRFDINEVKMVSFTAEMLTETNGKVIYALDLGAETDTAQIQIGDAPRITFPYAQGEDLTGRTEIVDQYVDAMPASAEQYRNDLSKIQPIDITAIEKDGIMTVYLYANQAVKDVTATIGFPQSLRTPAEAPVWTGSLDADQGDAFSFPITRTTDDADTLTVNVTSDKGVDTLDYYFPSLISTNEREVSAPNTYKGRFRYLEDETTARGIYYARVTVFDDDGIFDDEICTTTTDGNGYWECSGSASDGIFDDTIETFATIYAINSNFAEIKDAGNDRYSYKTTDRNTDEDGGITIDYGSWNPPSGNQNGAWHIMKSAGIGWSTVNFQTSETPPSNDIVFQYPGDSTGASFYNGRIHICGPACNDPDPWDETVHLHEYGHYIQDVFADQGPPNVQYCNTPGETSPCGHTMTSIEDPSTAYIEGWANYFQSWAKYYWGMPRPEDYIETTWSYDLEDDWRNPSSNAISIEGSIAGIMLDILDTAQDDQNNDGVGDILNLGPADVWDTFSFYNPPGSTKAHPWNMDDYYTGFQGRNSYDDEVRRIYYEHGIDKNNAPNAVTHVSPALGSTGRSTSLYLDFSAVTNTDNDDPLTYTVYLEAVDSTPDIIVCDDVTVTYCYVSGLDNLTWYYWRVKSEDVYGESAFSSAWWFRTQPVPTAVELSDTSIDATPMMVQYVAFVAVLGLVTVGLIKTNKRVG